MALLYDSSRFNDESEEFLAPEPTGALPSANNAQALTGLYQDVFNRAPDPGGYDYWLNAMDTMGYTPETVRSEFLKSPEYLAMQAPAPTPASTPAPAAPVGALPTVVEQVATPTLAPAPTIAPAPAPAPEQIVQKPVRPPAEARPEDTEIIEWDAPVSIGFGLYRTPGGNIINEQGYPVSQAEADRIMGVGAPAPSPAPAPAPSPAPASGALTQAAAGTPQAALRDALSQDPNLAQTLYNEASQQAQGLDLSENLISGLITGREVGGYTIRPTQVLTGQYDPIDNTPLTAQGWSATKLGKTPEGNNLETIITMDASGNAVGSLVRYFTGGDSGVEFYLDAQGNQIGEAKGFDYSEQWKSVVAPIVGMAASAFAGPLAAELSTALGSQIASKFVADIAARAIVQGGLGAVQAGLMGGDPLKAGLTGAVSGAVSAGGLQLANDAAAQVLSATGSQIAADAVRGAVQAGLNAVPGALVSGDVSGLGRAALTGAVTSGAGSAASQALAGTGITQQQIASGLTLAQQLQSPNPNISAIANAAAGLINNPDATVAAKAISLVDTISRAGGNPAALMGVMEAARQLDQAVQQSGGTAGGLGQINRLSGTTPGTTVSTGTNIDASGLSNIDSLGVSTYINAINQLGASADEALAAANAAMNSATSRLDTQNAIENATNFNDAFAKARAAYGSGKTFTWQGQEYSTSTRAEDPALAAASDAARQAAIGAGGGRGTAAGTSVADAVALGAIPLRTTPTTTTGNKVFEGVQYDALGNVIGGTAYNTEGVDTTTGLGRAGDIAAGAINTASRAIATVGPAAIQAGANLLSNTGGTIDLVAGRSTGVGDFLRGSADKISKFVDTISDPDVKAGQQRIGDAIDAADGFGNKVIALGRSMAQNPISALNWMLTEAFEEVPGVGMALKAGKTLGKYGIMGVSAINDMIESGGGAYNETYANAIQQGMSEADARAAARNSALASMLATGVTQGVVEGKLLTKVAGRETVGEGVEGAAQSAASQLALTGTVDPNKIIKDALIEAAVGKGASSTASGITGTGGAGTTSGTGAVTGTTTGTGAISTLTGTPGTTSTITGGNISTAGLDTTGLTGLDTGGLGATAIVNDYVNTVLQGGDASTAASTSVSNIINSAITGGADVSQATSNAVGSIITSAASSGANVAAVTQSAVGSAITSAVNSGANLTTAVTSSVNSAVTAAVNSGTNASTAINSAVTSSVNSAVTSAVNAGTDVSTAVNTAVNSSVNSAVTAAVNAGTDVNTAINTAVNSAVTSAVTSAVNSGANVNTAVTTAVNSAVTSAVNTATNTGTDVNTAVTSAVNTAVNSAVTTAVNSGVDTNTAVNTAVNSAVTAAVNAGVDTDTVIASAVTAAVNAGVDANVAVQAAVDAAVNAGVDANTATSIATKVDIPEVKPAQPSAPATSTLPEIPAVQTVPGLDVTPSTVPAVSAPAPAPAVTKPATTAKPSLPTQTGGGFALPPMTAGAALPSLAPQMLKSFETQGYVDPLAAVKQAQAEIERDQTMQNIDPRLLAILQERQQTGSLGQFAPEESANTPHYTYGTEDSIEDILGGQASGFAKGGYVAPLMATGGMTLPLMAKEGGLPSHKGGREDFRHGKHVAGEGDGQSDDIPAWLADGEFVFPADVVSALGNGSTKAGTDKLYEMMHAIRSRARSKGPKDLPPPALKSPLDYLKSKK